MLVYGANWQSSKSQVALCLKDMILLFLTRERVELGRWQGVFRYNGNGNGDDANRANSCLPLPLARWPALGLTHLSYSLQFPTNPWRPRITPAAQMHTAVQEPAHPLRAGSGFEQPGPTAPCRWDGSGEDAAGGRAASAPPSADLEPRCPQGSRTAALPVLCPPGDEPSLGNPPTTSAARNAVRRSFVETEMRPPSWAAMTTTQAAPSGSSGFLYAVAGRELL